MERRKLERDTFKHSGMILLILFSFIAGVVTILSPCILPILPIVLSGGITHDKRRPTGIIFGFIASFTFFTLFLSTIVRLFGIPAETLRVVSIITISLFGLGLVISQFQFFLEKLFTRLGTVIPSSGQHTGFWGGILIGLSIGLLWTPCVGPILASVISLALTGKVTGEAFLITLSYSLGTAIPMFGIMMTGRAIFRRVPWLLSKSALIQKFFGILMILTALALFFNLDRKFQTFILNTFPQYGIGLTKFEDVDSVQSELKKIKEGPDNSSVKITDSYLPEYTKAPEIIPGGEWLNSSPLSINSLRGKVVLIDFWTYTCINCQRTLPYLRDWHEKYKDVGLVIIGVHTPEFEFEKDLENVQEAIIDFELPYPIVQDNNYATWNAYSNRYWPAKYLIDKDGIIRYFHFGEGSYDETEKAIQALLEADPKSLPQVDNPDYSVDARTRESYLGYGRIENLASPEPIVKDRLSNYSYPPELRKSTFAFQGDWLLNKEYASPAKGSKLRLYFEAKEVFLVMRPKTGKTEGIIQITLDGKTPTSQAGDDVEEGKVTITSDSLYKIIKLGSGASGILELEFIDDNLELYAFTFG